MCILFSIHHFIYDLRLSEQKSAKHISELEDTIDILRKKCIELENTVPVLTKKLFDQQQIIKVQNKKYIDLENVNNEV